uniref:RIKEN cDNA 6820408C15 gene n=1 Tax=Cricetulus griseus TaxID=10029 RepID=A0A8C2LI58_CRIGR
EKNPKPSILPPLRPSKSRSKSKMKTPSSIQPVKSQTSVELVKNVRGLRKKEQPHAHRGRMQAKIRLMRVREAQSRRQGTAPQTEAAQSVSSIWQAVCTLNSSHFADGKRNGSYQQQGILGNIIDVLEYSNKRRVQQLRSELQEWKEKEESKANSLQQELKQLNAEILKAQEEVSFLSTYMDHEYPVRSVQIANQIRQVQQAKDRQQDELDNLREMREMVLGRLYKIIQEKKEKILKSLMLVSSQPHAPSVVLSLLPRLGLHTSFLCLSPQLIQQMKEEIPILTAEVQKMYAEICDPREVVFKDILLRRPKCTPDMDVELNIALQDPLLF